MQQHGGDIYTYRNMLDFSANLNPLGLPPGVIAAAQKGCTAAVYPDPLCRELTAALARHEQLPAGQMICGNGAADLIFRLVWALRPRRALLIAPGFAEYEQALKTVGCDIEYFYLTPANGYRLTEEYLNALHSELDMLFICNPNNPTGLTVPPPLLQKIVHRAAGLHIRVALDECFNDLLDDPAKHSLKNSLNANPHLFILKAFTKTYAMAGLRLGYALSADEGLLAAMREIAQPWSVSLPAQLAGVAALAEAAYVERARRLIAAERGRLLQELNRLGCQTFGAEANYIFFQTKPGLCEACRGHGLLIRDCGNYHGLTAGSYRVAVRLPEENDRMLDILAAALTEI